MQRQPAQRRRMQGKAEQVQSQVGATAPAPLQGLAGKESMRWGSKGVEGPSGRRRGCIQGTGCSIQAQPASVLGPSHSYRTQGRMQHPPHSSASWASLLATAGCHFRKLHIPQFTEVCFSLQLQMAYLGTAEAPRCEPLQFFDELRTYGYPNIWSGHVLLGAGQPW